MSLRGFLEATAGVVALVIVVYVIGMIMDMGYSNYVTLNKTLYNQTGKPLSNSYSNNILSTLNNALSGYFPQFELTVLIIMIVVIILAGFMSRR